MPLRNTEGWIGLVALSLPLAWAARQAGFPAAFLVGPMLGAVILSLSASTRIRVPRAVFVGAQALLGCAIARTITSSFLDSMSRNGLLMLLVVAVTILAGALVGWVLVRYGALPGTTAAWGSSPGGASAMIVVAEDYGADVRLVAFMQYTRVILVVLTMTLVSQYLLGSTPGGAHLLPPLMAPTPLGLTLRTLAIAAVSGLVGAWSRIPAGALLLPMILGGVLHALGLELVIPTWLLAIANVVLGWRVGLGFDRGVLQYVMRALPQVLLSTLLLIGLCAASSWMLTRVIDLDPLSAYLATSPGGVDSIAIIALGSRVDLSFVMAAQTLRLFMVIMAGPRIAKWLCRYARVSPPA